MSDNIFNDTLQGLNEAIDYVKGDTTKARKKIVSIIPITEYSSKEIKEIRNKNNMTQNVFAEILGVSKKTVEAWERGTNKPSGSAIRLLQLLESDIKILDYMLINQ